MEPEMAWAAGFFEAEGCIAANGRRVVAIVGNTDLVCLGHFADIVGRGTIYGPSLREGRQPLWRWEARGADAEAVLSEFATLLSRRRLAQWDKAKRDTF